ncbi:MAG: ferredoxin [Deltaproteobacteria bacterium]|nr:ferredoxin [Deltaproteobacteria bacterium]
MVKIDHEMCEETLLVSANLICTAARTAPKGKGKDLLKTIIVTGEEKLKIADKMRDIALREGLKFFSRDAENVDNVPVLVLLGTRESPLGLPNCGYCGFKDCDSLKAAGGMCAFNSGDLGIALGSAVSRAADLRIDNRILFSAGKAAVELGMLGNDIRVAYAIPLSVTGKNPFFDRK